LNYYDMLSLAETRLVKLTTTQRAFMLLALNRSCLTRVYPKGQRIDSSNYDPLPVWNCGCHMVALNYQTPDRSMQLNQGWFLANGRSGYIVQPDFLKQTAYNPFNKHTLVNVDPVTVGITVLSARHLVKVGRGIASPFVEVEIVGCDYDCNKYKTDTKVDNGFNPVWNEACEFDVVNPGVALLRFVVQDVDMFGDPNFLGQATFPLRCIRPGYRSVQLKNGFSEEMELTSLLVYIDIRNPKEEDDNMYTSIQELRDEADELQTSMEECERTGDVSKLEQLQQKLQLTQSQLLEKNEQRHIARTNKKRQDFKKTKSTSK